MALEQEEQMGDGSVIRLGPAEEGHVELVHGSTRWRLEAGAGRTERFKLSESYDDDGNRSQSQRSSYLLPTSQSPKCASALKNSQ